MGNTSFCAQGVERDEVDVYFERFRDGDAEAFSLAQDLQAFEKNRRFCGIVQEAVCSTPTCVALSEYRDANVHLRDQVRSGVCDINADGHTTFDEIQSSVCMLHPNYDVQPYQVDAQSFNENQKMFKMQLKLEEQADERKRDLSAISPRLDSEVSRARSPRKDGVVDEPPSYLLKPFHRDLKGDEPSELQLRLLEAECLKSRRAPVDLDSQGSRPRGLRDIEADMVYGRNDAADRGEPPERVMISSPNGQSECSGTYVLTEEEANGQPIWQQEDAGDHWLHSGTDGRWYVADASSAKRGFACAWGWLCNTQPHKGTWPHLQQTPWMWRDRRDSEWNDDPEIHVGIAPD